MWPQSRGITIDAGRLSEKLGIPVVKTEAHRRQGLAELREAILTTTQDKPLPTFEVFPAAFVEERERLAAYLKEKALADVPTYLLDRLLLDVGGQVELQFARQIGAGLGEHLTAARQRLKEAGHRVPAVEARMRYAWVRETLDGVITHPAERPATVSDRIDRILTHRVWGLVIFCVMMFIVFQAIYRWAGPFMDQIEAGQEWLAAQVIAQPRSGGVSQFDCRWRDRGRGRRAGVSAADCVSVLLHRPVGRLRLHGAGGVFDGQADDQNRPQREILRAVDVFVRLRDSRRDGDPRHRKPPRPHGHDSDRPADELLRPAAGVSDFDRGVHSRHDLPGRIGRPSRFGVVRACLRWGLWWRFRWRGCSQKPSSKARRRRL